MFFEHFNVAGSSILERLVTQVHSSDVLDVSQNTSTGAQAKLKETEVLGFVTPELNGEELTVGRERHRFRDPWINPRALKHDPGLAAAFLDAGRRSRVRC